MKILRIILACCCLAAGASQAADAPPEAKQRMEEYERIGRFIYAFHRAGVSTEMLRDPYLARRAPPELAGRARSLADRYDAVVKLFNHAPEPEMKAVLQEAAQVSEAIRLWQREALEQGPGRP